MSSEKRVPTAEPMAAFFDVRADGYEAHMRHHRDLDRLYAAVAEHIAQTDAPITILDLGCGTGMELAPVLKRAPNARITCVDVSAAMLDLLRQAYADRMEQITVVQASYLDWPYPQEAFDYALSTYSLHHLLPERKTAIYRNILAALKNGGCYIEADYMVREKEMAEALRQYHEKMAVLGGASGEYHIDIPFTPEVQVGLLREAGFARATVELEDLDSPRPSAVLRAAKA